jgi:hypothetical protein
MSSITVVICEAPESSADVYVVAGTYDQPGLNVEHSRVDGIDVTTVRYDSYPATRYCTEPEDYTDFPAAARALGALLDEHRPGLGDGFRSDANRYETQWGALTGGA